MAILKLKNISAVKLLIALIGLSFLLSACAIIPPMGAPFQTVQSIPSGKGILYVYDIGYRRSFLQREVLINDSAVGFLYGKDYLVFHIKPGPVTVSTGWETEINNVTVNVEPGGRYYVRVKSKSLLSLTDKWLITPEQVDEQEALAQLKDCGLAEPGIGLARELWGKVTPGTDLSEFKTMYVDFVEEGKLTPPVLAEGLRARGYTVTVGPPADMPTDTDAFVKVTEHWFWDLGMYLLALEVEILNPQTKAVYASAKVERADPQGRRGPKIMATEVLNAIFNGGMPMGVEAVRDKGIADIGGAK